MKIEIFFKRETHFGDPMVRCTIDENAAFYEGTSKDYICAELGVTPGFHELLITHYGKKDSDHLLNETNEIIIDKHLEIEKIIIDDIPFNMHDLWQGYFYPVYNEYYVRDCKDQGITLPPGICPNLYLGHNGTWKLSFHTPFVEYIIDKRKNQNINLKNSMFQSDIEVMTETKKWFLTAPDILWKA